MKVAVYTITKNEEQFIGRWADSARDADYLLVADTGSTDHTEIVAFDHKADVFNISVSPWRFDDARNASLALIPADADICIALDADEVLIEGWRDHLEAAFKEGINRPFYEYTWSWNADGSPGLTYMGDKIHARHGYRWRHPVHEVLTPTEFERRGWCGLKIHHYPDHSKSRSSYLPLLELSVREDPTDDRNAHYLGREYYYQRQYARAANELKRHLALPKAKWAPERAKSMRMLATCEPENREAWLLRAAAEDPTQREQWIALAQYYYDVKDWQQCYAAAMRALTITTRSATYINEAESWGPLPYDLAAIAAHHLGLKQAAQFYGFKAAELGPHDDRLKKNLEFYNAVE